jgi:hypothetical protein
MAVVRITHLIVGWDMRQRHKLRKGKKANSLKPGECLVAFNRSQKMARIIDCTGAIHDYYADEGRFSVDRLKKEVKAGIYLDLRVGQSEKRKVSKIERAAA